MNKSIDYELMLRDLCRLTPRFGWDEKDIRLTNEQLGICVREFEDLLGEALVDARLPIAQYLCAIDGSKRQDLIFGGIAAEVIAKLKDAAPGYIIDDLRDMAERIAREDADDRAYNRRALA